MKQLKRILAVLLAMVMLMSLVACNSKTNGEDSGKDGKKKSAEQVSGPITIEFWHTRGSGANGTHMSKVVDRFNETNEYGITVIATFMGSYDDCLSKGYTSLAAGNNPTIMIAGSGGIEMLAAEGVLADMSPYMERDEFNVNNIPEQLQHFMFWDDEVLSVPYTVSTPMFFYNKALWGTEAPTSIEDMTVKAAEVSKNNPGVYAFGTGIDAPFIQRPILKSLGSDGLLNKDATGAGCLEDGSMEKLLTDWSNWIKEGWCMAPDVTSSGTKMTQDFFQGKLASMFGSTGSMVNIMNNCKSAGIDLGVSQMIGYGGYTASVGGGHLVVLEKNHSQQEIAAAWEFMKFLYEDQQVAENAADTGYLPITYSSTETDIVKNLWAEYPGFELAFKQIEYATYNTRSTDSAEWNTQIGTAISYVIQDKSMSPKEAVDYLKTQEKIIFGN